MATKPGLWASFLLMLVCAANASGPRYVTGPPFFTAAAGLPIGWKQSSLLYYTDPGDLSSSVNHASADQLVAAAAGVWNVPVARITVGQGGDLAEHVSGQDVYLSSSGMVWPADVASTNYAAIPIAVVYDTDGSVTDSLLGAGSSDPSGCEQTGVSESVDKFDPGGYILHAIILLNGRCTGADPRMQLQMQYQLERVFGRVLGLAWSQTNDNVFTANPSPTASQAANWPIMHPLDILCGPYSYQCLPNPFSLRPDDIGGMVGLYGIPPNGTLPPGKQASLATANALSGTVSFPTGEGMAGVNVLVRREPRFSSTPQDWVEASAVSGSTFRRSGASPFVAASAGASGSQGTTLASTQGFYSVPYFQVIDPTNQQTEIISTEPLNPLYIGSASVGPYAPGIVAPAGSPPTPFYSLGVSAAHTIAANFPIADAPATCGDGTDGTAAAPVAEPASGWWNGLLCAYGHAAYVAATVKSARTMTVEVTALDANGLATTTKAMPVIGVFAPTDPTGSLPSIAVAPTAFNSLGLGTTTLAAAPFPAGSAGGTIRVGIADQRGDGRPDFTYQARVFYADTVSPATIDLSGGTVTITGTGFRLGNAVLINGVNSNVTSWNANAIVLTAPSVTAANATSGTPVDVEIVDLGTGASSIMSGALTYGTSTGADTMLLVSAPATAVPVGTTASQAFTVQLLGSDGVTPSASQPIVFSTTAGAAQFAPCGATACTISTDANGFASTAVTPTAAGTVTMLAAASASPSARVSASFPAQAQASSMMLVSAPSGSVPVGVTAAPAFAVQMLAADGKTSLAGQTIVFSVPAGAAIYSGCSLSTCSVVTNSTGIAQLNAIPTSSGMVKLQASNGNLQQTASFTGVDNSSKLVLLAAPSSPSYVNKSAGVIAVRLLQSDGLTPVPNTPILLAAPAAILLGASGTNTATIITAADGSANSTVIGTVAGTYSLQATYGDLMVSASLQVMPNSPTLTILSAPSGILNVGTASSVPFTAQLLSAAGKPMPGNLVAIGGTQGQVSMSCGAGACQLGTDSTGKVSSAVTPLLPGPITLTAGWLNLTATADFTAAGGVETLNVLAAPPPTVNAGSPIKMTFLVLGPDGVTPMPGRTLQLITTTGNVSISGCALGSCKYSLGSSGRLTVNATAYVPGPVTLQASVDGITQLINFTVLPYQYSMKTITAPGDTIVATASTVPFQVQILNADGVTPVSGENVTFSLVSGAASIAACPTSPCVVKTYSDGKASTGLITPGSLGPVVLTATDNSLTQSASFNALPVPVETVVASPASTWVAAGATVPLTLSLGLNLNGAPAAGQAVAWTGSNGFVAGHPGSSSDANGNAAMAATIGPLAGASSASATACAWTRVCGTFTAFSVPAAQMAITVTSGGFQSVAGMTALLPVLAEVTDAASHPVAGAVVNVGQQAYGLDVPCPPTGRCPAAPLLASSNSVLTTDLQGNITVTPLVVPGTATTTAMAFSTGTQGFAATKVSSVP